MTDFIETPVFPRTIGLNAARIRETEDTLVQLVSGKRITNLEREQRTRRYRITVPPRYSADYAEILHWLEALDRATGFRFYDEHDHSTVIASGQTKPQGILAPLDGTVETGTRGVGYGMPTAQLYARYARGAAVHDRRILKPRTMALYRNGVLAVAGAGAGQYAVNSATGVVTFVSDASVAVSTITPGATTQLTTATNPLGLVASDRLYLSGLAGADADLLNGLSHTINSVTGSGPYTWTLATDTTGATITVGTGAVAAFPQPDETLLWTGDFDVPVQFAENVVEDTMMFNHSEERGLALQAALEVVEIIVL